MTASALPADGLWHALRVEATLCEGVTGDVDAIGVRDGRIAWLGALAGAPAQWAFPAADTLAGARFAAHGFLRRIKACRTR